MTRMLATAKRSRVSIVSQKVAWAGRVVEPVAVFLSSNMLTVKNSASTWKTVDLNDRDFLVRNLFNVSY